MEAQLLAQSPAMGQEPGTVRARGYIMQGAGHLVQQQPTTIRFCLPGPADVQTGRPLGISYKPLYISMGHHEGRGAEERRGEERTIPNDN